MSSSIASRRKRIWLLLLAGLLICSTVIWLRHRDRPRLEFGGLRETAEGRTAVFILRNDGGQPYTYIGYDGDSAPQHFFSVSRESGWKDQRSWSCSVGSEPKELAPHSSQEVVIHASRHDLREVPFRIGLRVYRGTPAELRDWKPNFAERLCLDFRDILEWKGIHLGTLWSPVVKSWEG